MKRIISVAILLAILCSLLLSGCVVFGNKPGNFDDLSDEEQQEVLDALSEVEDTLEDTAQELEDAFDN